MADNQAGPVGAAAALSRQRDFSAERPNELWVAYISYLRCWQGLVFFAFVLDATAE